MYKYNSGQIDTVVFDLDMVASNKDFEVISRHTINPFAPDNFIF